MKSLFCYTTFLLFLSCGVMSLRAQDTLHFYSGKIPDTLSEIRVISRYSGDSAIVRWAPVHPGDWLDLNAQGYLVRRYQLDKAGLPVEGSLHEHLVKPWSTEMFQARLDESSDYVLAAAQCLYGAWESSQDGNLNMQGRYQELQNRYGIALLSADLDVLAANALGLRLIDRTAGGDLLYLYQVLPADTSLPVAPGASLLLTVADPMPRPVIDHIVEDEGYVNIKWRRDAHETDFSAYWIESSADGKTFVRLNDVPFVGGVSEEYPSSFFSYKHTVANYTPHFYRIIGLNAFGEVSEPSEIRIGQARDRTPPPEPVNLRLHADAMSGSMTLSWDKTDAPDLSGYRVYRAPRYEGEYQIMHDTLLPPDSIAFHETLTDTRRIWFYQVASVDTAGNINTSRIIQAAFRDTISPATPTGLAGTIDSNGIVRLQWRLGTEPDLRGYYVYMANQADHYFTNMTAKPVLDTVWSDTITLRTFTEEIYYRVAAVDFHSHFSEWTEPLKLSKPDTIRPFPPAFTGYRVEKDHIALSISPSRSKDVVSHVLDRRQLPDGVWQRVQGFEVNTAAYDDFEIEPNTFYEYRLTATDDAGLTQKEPVLLRVKYADLRRPVPPVVSVLEADSTSLTLRVMPGDTETTGYIIYRASESGPYMTIARTTSEDTFRDPAWSRTTNYAYRVRAVWPDGQKSDFSNTITGHEIQ